MSLGGAGRPDPRPGTGLPSSVEAMAPITACMGVQDRDWYRADVRRRVAWTPNRVLAAALSLLALVLIGYQAGVVGVPGVPGPTLGTAPGLDANDPWLAWIAPENVCPGSERADLPPPNEVRTMLCLINYARAREGLNAVVLTTQLNRASTVKGQDIARCRRFEHAACGKAPDQVAIDAGYTGSFGENLYANESEVTAPRDAIDGWLNSPEHRENLFRAEWRTAGLAAVHGAAFGSFHDAVIWVSEFGDV